MKYLTYSLLLFCLAISCKEKQQTDQKPLGVIHVAKAFEEKTTIPLSSVAEDVEYIQLETKKECVTGGYLRVFVDDDYIVAISFRKNYLFNRNTGKFIREIGHYGKDPGGYMATGSIIPYDEECKRIRSKGWHLKDYLNYNISGELIQKINAPLYCQTIVSVNDDVYAGFVKNMTGSDSIKIILFDENGKCLKQFRNNQTFEPTENVVRWGNHGWFYRYNEELSFYELFTDTIYKVTEERLIPKHVFYLGKYAPPYDQQKVVEFMLKKAQDYFFLEKIYESRRNLFFQISYNNKNYLGLYDKASGETIMNTANERYPTSFENDIDSLLPFTYSSVNSSNELIGFMNSYEVMEWLQEHPEKASQLPEKLQWMKSLKEDDNPVVMIARLKE
ncbi:6-bladed beta-propeller [Puteibacter caeruleilacunae]|nr:6-bladed beta-propeller [Puteibacter caeruleilacunae]